jgi:hypothetical protein
MKNEDLETKHQELTIIKVGLILEPVMVFKYQKYLIEHKKVMSKLGIIKAIVGEDLMIRGEMIIEGVDNLKMTGGVRLSKKYQMDKVTRGEDHLNKIVGEIRIVHGGMIQLSREIRIVHGGMTQAIEEIQMIVIISVVAVEIDVVPEETGEAEEIGEVEEAEEEQTSKESNVQITVLTVISQATELMSVQNLESLDVATSATKKVI